MLGLTGKGFSGEDAGFLLPGSRMRRPHEAVGDLAERLSWRVITSRKYPEVEHVNIQMLGAIAY
jgi:hypothetical protein